MSKEHIRYDSFEDKVNDYLEDQERYNVETDEVLFKLVNVLEDLIDRVDKLERRFLATPTTISSKAN